MGQEIFKFIDIVFQFLRFGVIVYNMVFFVWILSTWLPVDRSIMILRFVDSLIEPVYHTLLRLLPPLRFGVMDFSPFYLFIFLTVLENFILICHQLIKMLLLQFIG